MFKRVKTILVASLMIALMVPSFAFAAANGAADPIQAKSSDTATIYVGKVLTVAQANKFPTVTDFTFTIENIKAWDNANVSTSENGTVIAANAMPQPAAVTTDHQKVTRTDATHATVEVGNFAGNANTNVADTATEKYRSTPVNITYTKAGYYMYKITENASVPEAIPGMSYDNKSYYVVVYVCNNTDDQGNTIPGVYVHDITSFRNSTETNTEPNLTDIQNETDNNNVAAVTNNYDNLAKVGKSVEEPGPDPDTGNPIGPNKLEAYRFFNDHTTHDVVVTNNVTGNLGDITKEFEYTVTLTGLEKNKEYTTNVPAEEKTSVNQTSATAELQALTSGGAGTIDSANKKFTSDANGNATFRIKLADDEVMVFNALPATAKYKVEELASDHIASFTSESTKNDSWIHVEKTKANTQSDNAISTSVETVDAVSNVPGRNNAENNDGTVTIKFRNHRDLVTPTGLPYYGDFAYVIAALAAAAAVAFVVRRRKSQSTSVED